MRISGNILPSLKLTVVGNQFRGAGAANVSRQPSAISRQLSAVSYQLSEDGWRATVASQGRTFADIRLAREGETSASHITIPLEIRTNAAYQLKLSLVTPDGCAAGVRAYTDSARAGGMRVAADAITNSRRIDISNLSQAASATAVFSGTRVSMGGNFVTPGNALLVHLNLVFPEGQPRCEGQPVIRLSLEPSI
ncbi:MAG: hypothetical protein L0229_12785 [Blastocatellia bacterium]|nr:hypothetical protein [Blastocatellia bacterium]